MVQHIFTAPAITEEQDLALAIQKGYKPTLETREEFTQQDSYPEDAVDLKSFTKMDGKTKYSYAIITETPNPQTTEQFWKEYFNKKFLREHFLEPMLAMATSEKQKEIEKKQAELDSIKKSIEVELVNQTL